MRLTVLFGLLAMTAACSSKDSTDEASISSTIAEIASSLNVSYPGSLSISVFPTDTTTKSLRLDDAEAAPESLKAKEEEAESYLNGTAENCLPPSLLRPEKKIEEGCYEFDQEMIYGAKDSHQHGTRNGKSTLTGSSEACLVSFSRAQVKAIESIIDQGLGLQQAMICQAAKDGVDAAAASTEDGIDLSTSLGEAADTSTDTRKPTLKVTEAKMSKDADGVYRVSIKASMTKDGKTNSQTYTLAHVPDDTENTTYHGVMSITREEPANPGNPVVGNRYISVSYSRTSTDGVNSLKTELRAARLATSLESQAFNADGTFNYNAGADSNGAYTGITDPSKAISQIVLVGFDLNTDDNTGTFEYWQNPGSNYGEAARGMIFKLEKNADTGRLEGCGMSGAALGSDLANSSWMSIRKSMKTGTALSITGSYHPFFNLQGGGSCTGSAPESCTKTVTMPANITSSWEVPQFSVAGNTTAAATWAKNDITAFVTRQCINQNTDGVYEIDTTEIADTAGYVLFNPTNTTSFVISRPDRPKDPPPASPAAK